MSQPERVFKALGDPIRIKILQFLQRPEAGCCTFGGRICACDVERVAGVAQATVSHHMKLLVDAGLVRAEKHGRWMFYRLDGEAFGRAVEFLAPFAQTGACTPAEVAA